MNRQALAAAAPGAAVAPAFNRGHSQVNFNFLQWGGAYPFLNAMKTAQDWGLIDNSGPPDPSSLDGNGYPIRISNGGVYTVFFVPSQILRPGNYVMTWNGNGTVHCGMNNTPVSGSKTSAQGSGRYVFSTTDTRFVIGIAAIGAPYITNLRVFHADDEAALDAGEVFGQQFKSRLREANFGVLRFLNWQNGNMTNVTTWATRKSVDYVFYSGDEYRSTLYAGTTTNAGNDYSATLPAFKLEDKATVIIKFNASAKGPCTLNISGTGAINILDQYAQALSSWSYPVGGTGQSMATLVYDATLRSWLKLGGDQTGSSGLANACPPEIMVRLCAEVGAHPYFVTPPYSIDPATDYMSSLAAYCRDNAPGWMVPRFEGPNETWNYSGGFIATQYGASKANVYGWGKDPHNWYGKALSVLGQAISKVHGGDRTRYQIICGVQTVFGETSQGTASHDPRLDSPRYVNQSSPAQAGYTKTPAKQWVTHICCANYHHPSDYKTPAEARAADEWASATPERKRKLEQAYAATTLSGNGQFTVPHLAVMYENWKRWALRHDIRRMCGYEGGYSPDYVGPKPLNEFRAASKLAPILETATTQNYRNFVELTDADFIAEFPSCFQLSGNSPSDNAWSVLEDIHQNPDPPQWTAMVAFNHPAHSSTK